MNIYYLLSGTVIITLICMYFGYKSALKYELGKSNIIVPDDAFERMVIGRIRCMDGREFEEFCQYIFMKNGFRSELTPSSHDFGKDIVLNNKIYVECKCYNQNNSISSPMINKLLGSCVSDGITEAIFITTSYYTSDCYKILEKTKKGIVNIKLWDMNDLIILCEGAEDRSSVLTWLGYDVKYLDFA